jgi:sterol desaturase/sphingolipid hydroxylase (fatty acid hydroxylase superfamily)
MASLVASIDSVVSDYWLSCVDYFGIEFLWTWGLVISHELLYFGSYIPFFLCDYVPSLQRYKIQPTVQNDAATQWKCVKRLLFNHAFVQAPMIFAYGKYFRHWLAFPAGDPVPSITTIALQCAICFVLEDFIFYWVHLALHSKLLYKAIHKVHHDHTAPFGIAAEYAHPAETLFLGAATIGPPILLRVHALTLYCWLAVRLFQTIEVHSGYDFPWSPNNWLPFWGGAEYHDFHHKTFLGPYSSSFTYTDYWFGTRNHYDKHRAELEKKAKKA